MCATLSVASPRCAGRGTAICCGGPFLSLLRLIAMMRIKYRAARPKLRAAEQRAGGGHRGAPKKRPLTAIRGGRDSSPCLRALPDGNRVPRSSALAGAPGVPRKSSLGPLLGAAEIAACPRARCQTDIEGRGAARWRGPPGRPEKAALDSYTGPR